MRMFGCLSEGAALDLLAVLSASELLVVGLVFAGHKSTSQFDSWALSQTNISGETSDLAGNSFHTFFALNNSTVDVIDTFYNIGHGVNILARMSLLSSARIYVYSGDGGEKEGKASKDQDRNEKGSNVETALFAITSCPIVIRRLISCSIASGRGIVS